MAMTSTLSGYWSVNWTVNEALCANRPRITSHHLGSVTQPMYVIPSAVPRKNLTDEGEADLERFATHCGSLATFYPCITILTSPATHCGSPATFYSYINILTLTTTKDLIRRNCLHLELYVLTLIISNLKASLKYLAALKKRSLKAMIGGKNILVMKLLWDTSTKV